MDINRLTPAEQLDLLERLWDRLSQRPESIPVTQAQSRELDSRLVDLERDIHENAELCIPWDDVVRQIRSR